MDGLCFADANLIVGKNSAGKSRALSALNSTAKIIAQGSSKKRPHSFRSELTFVDKKGRKISYTFSLNGKKVAEEYLFVDNKQLIERSLISATIQEISVNPPEEMLLLHVQRDVEKYPVFEEIIKWAEESVVRSFIDKEKGSQEKIYSIISGFSQEMKHHLVEMTNKIGFPLTNLTTMEGLVEEMDIQSPLLKEELKKLHAIVIREQGIGVPLFLKDLSSGMFRTILLLVLIEQMINLNQPVLLAIDDLGEGLDYSRAKKLGELLFDICSMHNIQLIATSNEEFMMNIVDIDRWNILVRKGNHVKSLSASTCPDEFEVFKYSGLSNFDFFTSDFLNNMSSKIFDENK